MMAQRDIDVVVFGASGVTGRCIARHLAERAAETGAHWAAAARDPGKLELALGGVGISAPVTMIVDASERDSLRRLASRAKVVINAVRPFAVHGQPVIEACLAEGTHYVDVSGEMPFTRRTIDDFHAVAAAAGVKIVQSCGFLSMPADLSVLLATETAQKRWAEALADVELKLHLNLPSRLRPSDGGGAGSAKTIVGMMLNDADSARVTDPAALISDNAIAAEVRRRGSISVAPRLEHGVPIAPMFPVAFVGPAVVHRTAMLMAAEQGAYLEPFSYREGWVLSGGIATFPLRYALAGALAVTQGALARGSRAHPALRRRIAHTLCQLLPDSGHSPPLARQGQWGWTISIKAHTQGGHELSVDVASDGHIGYLATGRIVGEAALLLAEDGASSDRAGCLTPAAAFGTESIERFRHAHLRFALDAVDHQS